MDSKYRKQFEKVTGYKLGMGGYHQAKSEYFEQLLSERDKEIEELKNANDIDIVSSVNKNLDELAISVRLSGYELKEIDYEKNILLYSPINHLIQFATEEE